MDRSDTILVKANSRRAAMKLARLVGKERQEVFSMYRNTGRGAYRIPKRFHATAHGITGITGMRDGPDLLDMKGKK